MTLRTRSWPTLLILMLSVAGLSGATAQESDSDPIVSRVYRIQYLNIMDAVMIAQQICLAERGEKQCDYNTSTGNWFTYRADESIHEKIAAALEDQDGAPGSLNFRVALFMAGQDSGDPPSLPDGEQRALDDLKQFLPYKGFRFVDSGWVRSRGSADLRLGGEPGYEVAMRFRWNSAGSRREILVERFELFTPLPVQNKNSEEDARIAVQKLLGTSFSLQVDETVVVGTSKLNGNDEALVVLLTAAE